MAEKMLTSPSVSEDLGINDSPREILRKTLRTGFVFSERSHAVTNHNEELRAQARAEHEGAGLANWHKIQQQLQDSQLFRPIGCGSCGSVYH